MAEVQITTQDDNINGKPLKVIGLVGQLDETNVDEEAKKIYQAIDEMAVPNLLLDFSGLTYINSKAIGYVTDWYSRVAAKNGKVAIARPQANILDILKVVGITQIITIHETMDDAKAALASDSAPVTETPIAAPAAPEAAPTATPEPTPEAIVPAAPEEAETTLPETPAAPIELTPPTTPEPTSAETPAAPTPAAPATPEEPTPPAPPAPPVA